MASLKVGDITSGMVSGIKHYGIFVSLKDGYTGLIHISEISDKFVNNVYDYVNINERINVKVIDIDEKNKQCKLSIKDVNYIMIDPDNDNIEEVGSGFTSLKKCLDKWIDDKKIEIIEENSKKS